MPEEVEDTRSAMEREAEVIGLLWEYDTLTGAINDTKKRQDQIKVIIKTFMEAEDMDELSDDERGITVRLQKRRGSVSYDLASFAGKDAAAVARLACIPGFFSVNNRAVEALGDSSADLAALREYSDRAKGTTALIIEKKP